MMERGAGVLLQWALFMLATSPNSNGDSNKEKMKN
jgi:hypothetical protein